MKLSIQSFGGLQPRIDPSLLPENAATVAHDCRLRSGKCAPLKQSGAFFDYPVRLENGLVDMAYAKTLYLWKRGTRKEFMAWPGHVTVAPSNIFDDNRYRVFVAGATGKHGTEVEIPGAPSMAPSGEILKHKFVQVFVGNYSAGECSSMSAEYTYMDGLSPVHGHILFEAVATPPAGSTSRKIYKVLSADGSSVSGVTQAIWEQTIDVDTTFHAFDVEFDSALDLAPAALTIISATIPNPAYPPTEPEFLPNPDNIAPAKDSSQADPDPVPSDYVQNTFIQTYVDAYGRESACSPISNYVTYKDSESPAWATSASPIASPPDNVLKRRLYKVLGVYGDKVYVKTEKTVPSAWEQGLTAGAFTALTPVDLDSANDTPKQTLYFSEQFVNQPCVYVSAIDSGGFDRSSICLEKLPKCGVTRTPEGISPLNPVFDPDNARYTFFFQTWVNAYGYESQVSESSDEVIYNDGDSMSITAVTPVPEGAVARRIYKVVTGTETESIQFIWEQAVGTDEFGASTFTVKDEDAGDILTPMTECPKDLAWIVNMPGGFYAGFATSKLREICFSEMDIPTSYPTAYRYPIREDAVGLAVSGNTVFVMTVGQPYAISGTDPNGMTVSRIASNQGCISKYSICTMNNAVFYASQDGVCMLSEGNQAEMVMTKSLFKKEQWTDLNPSSCLMVAHDAALHMFFEKLDGTRVAYVLDMIDGTPVLTTQSDVANAVYADVESDGLYMIKEVLP